MKYKNDAVLISAHCNTDEKVKSLRSLVKFLHSSGKDVFLVSNTIVPDDIINLVRFFLYDSVNDIVVEKSLRFPVELILPGMIVSTRNIPWTNTIHPVLRMMFNGIRLCMMSGYRIVHYMEYDVEISSIDHIEENNTDIMNGKTCIYYSDGSGKLMGGSLVFDTFKYREDTFNYDKEKIERKFGDLYESCEMYCLHELMLPFNSLEKPLPSLEKNGVSFNKSNSGRNGMQTGILFYNGGRISYLFFVESGCDGCNFGIVMDGDRNEIYLGGSGFYINDIPEGVKNVELYRNNSLICSYDLENSEDINHIKNQTEIIKF
jgi:hypothetical protein